MTRKFEISRVEINKRVEALTLTFKEGMDTFDLELPKELCEAINLGNLDERFLMYLIEYKQDRIIKNITNLLNFKNGRKYTFHNLPKDILSTG